MSGKYTCILWIGFFFRIDFKENVGEKQMRLRYFDWLIALLSLAIFILTIAYWQEQVWLIIATFIVTILFLVLGFLDRGKGFIAVKEEIKQGAIGQAKQLILLNEENQELTAWDLFGRTSLVIGRDEGENQVDINLGDVTYAGFIEIEHAVLNYAKDHWYIEDLHSENGVKVQKAGDARQYKLATDKPCRLGIGDVIYIAQTRLEMR